MKEKPIQLPQEILLEVEYSAVKHNVARYTGVLVHFAQQRYREIVAANDPDPRSTLQGLVAAKIRSLVTRDGAYATSPAQQEFMRRARLGRKHSRAADGTLKGQFIAWNSPKKHRRPPVHGASPTNEPDPF